MSWIRRIYIYSQCHIALCAALLYIGGCLVLSQPIHMAIVLLVFFATLGTYNAHRLFSRSMRVKNHNDRYSFTARNTTLVNTLVTLSAILSVILFFYIPYSSQVMIVISGMISIGYILPLVLRKRLRDIGKAKIVMISIVWALLPILSNIAPGQLTINSLIFLEHFAFIFALTIPFDIRDQRRDRRAKVSNLANQLGFSKLQIIFHLFTAGMIICALVLYVIGVYTFFVLIGITALAGIMWIANYPLEKVRREWYYLFFLDGLIGVKGLIYLLIL